LLTAFKCFGQSFDPSSITDTIKLKNINFKKVLAYKINSATVLVSYEDFMKAFAPFWKKYKRGVRSLNRGKLKAIEENPSWVRRSIFLDSTYKRLTAQIKTMDTVYINQWSFALADIGTSYDFVGKIDQGSCIVLDNNNVRQTFVLKQKYSYQKGFLDGWSGRLYFINGQQKPFIRGTDWVS
jgi:hypothetical protein